LCRGACGAAAIADRRLALPRHDSMHVHGLDVEQYRQLLRAGDRLSPLTAKPHRIVIVGGGAGGLPLAAKLGDRYGRGQDVQVTLVDRNATHVWKPLLHEVAAGRMNADSHALDYPAIAYWHHFRFKQGALRGLDRAGKQVLLDRVKGPQGEEIL